MIHKTSLRRGINKLDMRATCDFWAHRSDLWLLHLLELLLLHLDQGYHPLRHLLVQYTLLLGLEPLNERLELPLIADNFWRSYQLWIARSRHSTC